MIQLLYTTFLRFLCSFKDLKDVPAACNYCKVHQRFTLSLTNFLCLIKTPGVSDESV